MNNNLYDLVTKGEKRFLNRYGILVLRLLEKFCTQLRALLSYKQ
ncbi:hypothetical protein TMUPMC115_1304 [Tetragenococcus muriaticus PMC-11-5]|uniref:Uncharacterized protein n=1 Tax=Tetragenococcus muriaticus PMC-11-5 TaxID=1302649 RepID=A0A091C3Q8_9ENTE|nr:hypothetical protein TMUPMC115_1304 [Tetragenococcus muriaticus PMC-11-5]